MNAPLMVTLILIFLSALCSLLFVFLVVNIWQRQRAEEALSNTYAQLELKTQQNMAKFRHHESRFRLVAESAYDLLYEWDVLSTELTWFGDVDAVLGFNSGEFPHTLEAWQGRIHSDDQSHMFDLAVLEDQKTDVLHFEYRIQAKHGEWHYWDERCLVLFDEDGQPYKLMGGCNDITTLRLNEQILRKSETKYRSLIESLGSEYFFYRHDIYGTFTYISPSIKQVLGYSQAEFLFHYTRFFTDNPINLAADKYTQLSIQGQKQPPYELEIYKKNGDCCRLRVTELPLFTDDGRVEAVQGIAQDITLQYQVRLLQKGRTEILEMIAKAQPLSEILHTIIEFLESLETGMLCSIMLFDAEHSTLHVGAAPNLPKFYNDAINGVKIADGVGACGTAIFRGEQVITEDILNHPYWSDFYELMVKTPLRSCWSEPVFSRSGQVLGTFAMYYRSSRLPNETEQHLVQSAVSLAAIAIDQHNSLQAIQNSEKRLSTLIESVPDAIYFKDGEGRWQVVNSAGLQAFNLQNKDWQGKTELQLAEMQSELRSAHEACLASDEIAWQHKRMSRILEEITDEEGHTHYFDVTKVPLFDAQDKREALVIIGRNVTEQKQMEATLRDNQRYLQAALNASGAGTFLYDAHTDTNYWDERSLEIFGLSAHEFGNNYEAWRQCVHPEDLQKVEPIFQQALIDNDSVDLEFRAIRSDNSIHHIKAQAWILRNEKNEVSKISGLHFDITENKHVETELKQAKDYAEAASRAKSAFIANMSHELRTPLNSILGYAHILQQTPSLDEEQHEQLQSIHENGQHLLMLINDVLDLSKIEAGKIELQPHDFLLNAFFQDIAHYFSLKAAKKALEFVYESELCAHNVSFPALVRADEKRLRQILVNLLSNAIKFTQYGGVRLLVRYHCDNYMKVIVEDNGCGIAKQDLSLIFLPFQQLNSVQYQEGTGLGLSITQKLLLLMDSELKVDSQLGKGSCFSFTMPLNILSWEKNQASLESQANIEKLSRESAMQIAHVSIPQMHPSVLKNLCAMADLGDVTAILDYTAKLQKNSCIQDNDFYIHLINLAQNFKIDELQSLLQQLCNVLANKHV